MPDTTPAVKVRSDNALSLDALLAEISDLRMQLEREQCWAAMRGEGRGAERAGAGGEEFAAVGEVGPDMREPPREGEGLRRHPQCAPRCKRLKIVTDPGPIIAHRSHFRTSCRDSLPTRR